MAGSQSPLQQKGANAWLQRLRSAVLHPTALQTALVAGLCLGLALAAQRSLDRHRGTASGLLVYAVAAVLFALAFRAVESERSPKPGDAARGARPTWPLVALTLGLSLLGCLDLGGNRFRALGLALWLGGLLLTVLYLWLLAPAVNGARRSPAPGGRLRSPRAGLRIPAHWLVLAAIVLMGTWFRFRLLREIPADVGPDLIYNYYDTADIVQGKYPIFFPDSQGREGLFYYCAALAARVVGTEVFTVHVASALLGTLTIIALYWLGSLAYSHEVGLLAALLLALNRWHILLSRSGYRAIAFPLLTVLVLATLVRALRHRRWVDWACAGVPLGLVFYTYKSSPFMPVMVLAGLALYAAAQRGSGLRRWLSGVALMFSVALVVLAPEARYAAEYPQDFFMRERVQMRLQREQQELSPGLLTYYGRSLLQFTYEGEPISRLNVPLARHMGFVSAGLLALGLGYTLWRWRHGFNSLLLAAFFVLLLPAAASMLPHDPPSSLRSSGLIGPVVLLAALPLAVLVASMRKSTSRYASLLPEQRCGHSISLQVSSAGRQFAWTWQPRPLHLSHWILALTLGVLLLAEARETYRFVFYDYPAHAPDKANYSVSREVALEIEHYGDLGSTYVVAWPNWTDTGQIRANLRADRNWEPNVTGLAPDRPPLSTLQGTALFIVHPADQASQDALQAAFARWMAIPHEYPDGQICFWAYYVER